MRSDLAVRRTGSVIGDMFSVKSRVIQALAVGIDALAGGRAAFKATIVAVGVDTCMEFVLLKHFGSLHKNERVGLAG